MESPLPGLRQNPRGGYPSKTEKGKMAESDRKITMCEAKQLSPLFRRLGRLIGNGDRQAGIDIGNTVAHFGKPAINIAFKPGQAVLNGPQPGVKTAYHADQLVDLGFKAAQIFRHSLPCSQFLGRM
jgi:hypothetical protein